MEYRPFSAKLRPARIPYYIRSLFVLFRELESNYRLQFIKDLLFFSGDRTIYLKNKLVFKLKSFLDLLTLKEVVIDDEYQCHEVNVDNKDKIIVDVGAGFGDFSVMTAKRFPKAKIYAFESDPTYFTLLGENIQINNVKNIFPFRKKVDSLEQVFTFIQADHCGFIKMDCEGCEFSIINKKSMVYLKRINKLAMEYHEINGKKAGNLRKILENTGFKINIFPRAGIDRLGLLSGTKQ